MTDAVKYPEWQKTFRDMQAVRDQRHAEQQAKAREENAEAERKAGYRLQQALMHFGIYLDPAPQVNLAEVGGFQFKLLGGTYNFGKQGDRETYCFDLIIQKPIPGREDDDEGRSTHYRHIAVNTNGSRVHTDWDYELCQLADAFDAIDEAVAFDIQRDAERKQRAAAQPSPAAKPETAEEKLLKVLRSLIREEIVNHLE